MPKKQQDADMSDDSESLDQEKEVEEKRNKPTKSSESKSIKDSKLSFPWRLHQMLNDSEGDRFDDIVSWQPDGKSFKVHKNADFVSRVMPKYFNQTKFKSFGRQLHIYGFKWVSKGEDKGAYFHPEFIRSDMSLCLNIFRKKFKGVASQSAKILEDDDIKSTEPQYQASLKVPPHHHSIRSSPQTATEPQYRASLKSSPPQSSRSCPQTATEPQYRDPLKGPPRSSSRSGAQHGSEGRAMSANSTPSPTHSVDRRIIPNLQPTDPIVGLLPPQAAQMPRSDFANVGSYLMGALQEGGIRQKLELSPGTFRNAPASDFLPSQHPIARLPEPAVLHRGGSRIGLQIPGILHSGGSRIGQQIPGLPFVAQGLTSAESGPDRDILSQDQAPDIPANAIDLEPRSIEEILAYPHQQTLQSSLETLFRKKSPPR